MHGGQQQYITIVGQVEEPKENDTSESSKSSKSGTFRFKVNTDYRAL